MWTTQVLILSMFATLLQVNGITVCDQNIVNNILNSTHCLKNIPITLQGLSPMTVSSVIEGAHNPGVQCIKYTGSEGANQTHNAQIVSKVKDETAKHGILNFTHVEVSCNFMKDYYENNVVHNVYFVSVEPVTCFYRCTEDTHVSDFHTSAACAVPISRRNDPDVLAAMEAGKASLAAAGVKDKLTNIETCSD